MRSIKSFSVHLAASLFLLLSLQTSALAQKRSLEDRVVALEAAMTKMQSAMAGQQVQIDVLQKQNESQQTEIKSLNSFLGSLLNISEYQAKLIGGLQIETKTLGDRVGWLESLLIHFSREGDEICITGANLCIVNGEGSTSTTNGLGNLIIGYNASGTYEHLERGGSHNLVLGWQNQYSSYGGIVAGQGNWILGAFASVTGGTGSSAQGDYSSVTGGANHLAVGRFSSIFGGNGQVTFDEFDWRPR